MIRVALTLALTLYALAIASFAARLFWLVGQDLRDRRRG